MKIDRCYILLGVFNRQSQSGDGSDFWEINLREILGGLYDKYSKFNLKLEAYHSRTAGAGTLPSECQFLQVAGFNWIGGLDTNVAFSNSRVAGATVYDHTQTNNAEFFRGMIYPSNIATLTFSRHADPKIIMELFSTDPDLTTKVNPFFGNEGANYLFSITGVDDRTTPLYREPEIIEKTGQLVLNTQNALALEVNRRAVRWSVDLSQLIDPITYNKYSKFALITKMILVNTVNANFSAWFGVSFLMSGLNWYSPNLKLNSTYTGSTTSFAFHQGSATAVALVETANADFSKETFIDSVFYKPSTTKVDLTITYNGTGALNLIGVSAPVLPFYFIFNLVPVDD